MNYWSKLHCRRMVTNLNQAQCPIHQFISLRNRVFQGTASSLAFKLTTCKWNSSNSYWYTETSLVQYICIQELLTCELGFSSLIKIWLINVYKFVCIYTSKIQSSRITVNFNRSNTGSLPLEPKFHSLLIYQTNFVVFVRHLKGTSWPKLTEILRPINSIFGARAYISRLRKHLHTLQRWVYISQYPRAAYEFRISINHARLRQSSICSIYQKNYQTFHLNNSV